MNNQILTQIINKLKLYLIFFLFTNYLVGQEEEGLDLTELSFDEIINYEISSVSKYKQKLSSSPAAAYVITNEEIRRSGATSIADSLRGVPGLEVARTNKFNWAISSRGFSNNFANKLLVLIDGRSVYNPIFSGVHWDTQDTLLEDIDRIEVIRGPGATLWGSNAVNGVINITTKDSRETQGLYSSIGVGNERGIFGDIRYGNKLNDNIYYRVYLKYFDEDHGKLASGADARDQWDSLRGGFRVDWYPSQENSFTFQSDVYSNKAEQVLTITMPNPGAPPPPFNFNATLFDDSKQEGIYFLTKFKHQFSDDSDLQIKAYVDQYSREQLNLDIEVTTFDLDMQHNFPLWENHQLIWGMGYRWITDDLGSTSNTIANPENTQLNLYNSFVQDEIEFLDDKLRFIIGAKFEYNDYTDSEFQPNGRVVWTPNKNNTFWGSISRAVRIPSRSEREFTINHGVVANTPGLALRVNGNQDFNSEELLAYELGYRIQPNEKLSFDMTAYYNDYNSLRGGRGIPVPPNFVLNIQNSFNGETYGFEIASNIQLTDRWLLRSNYSFSKSQVHSDTGGSQTLETQQESSTPLQQFFVRSIMDLSDKIELDTTLRYVDSLSGQNVSDYLTLDVHISWEPIDNLEISIVAQNLLDNQHAEFIPGLFNFQRSEVEESIYGKITWRF